MNGITSNASLRLAFEENEAEEAKLIEMIFNSKDKMSDEELKYIKGSVIKITEELLTTD